MDDIPTTRPSLLVRLRDNHDEQAWDEFVTIYRPLVYRVARRMGLQDADALELVQEAMIKVARAISRWDADPARGSFRSWLFQVSRNLVINFLVAEARRARASGDTAVGRLLAQLPARETGEASRFDLEYRRQLLQWAAPRVRAQGSSNTWNAFWRTSVEGQDATEVARQLGMTVGAVYIARSRVMARLRKEIDRVEGRASQAR
jgi:RNA polymerase sigma-70 factor (ECF subfamily)